MQGDTAPHVAVVGGGLAGMAAALRLRQRGCRVTLYDAAARLGGKAGATRNGSDFDEHGYHIFPLWYRNTWNLVDELGIRGHFVDCSRFHQLHAGEFPRYRTLTNIGSLRWALSNLVSGVLPLPEMFLFLYSNVDLASERLESAAFLDQITVAGFIRSRFYRTDRVAREHQDLVLKGISVPSYFVSAKTMQNVISYWFSYPVPMYRILRGNLQQQFIHPLQRRLEALGCEIRLGQRLQRIALGPNGVERILLGAAGEGAPAEWVSVDRLVLAIPLEQVRTVLDDDLFRSAPELFGVQHLRAAPMAALDLYLTRRLPGLPRDHVNLVDSQFGLSFIDVSQTWPTYDTTVLNVIASDFTSIQGLDEPELVPLLLEELQRYLHDLRQEDISHYRLMPNTTEPLFMNDVGAWPYRPTAKSAIGNLYVAGDYCQSPVDLVSMEGAISTGLLAAEALRQDVGLGPPVEVRWPVVRPRAFFLAAKWALLPLAVLAKLAVLRAPSPPTPPAVSRNLYRMAQYRPP
jgi:protoporphyrinogen oxidase